MDKAEYQVRLGHIKELVDSQDYEGALKIVQTIEWKRVKSVNTLCMVADIYEANGMLEDCRRILRLAYNRSPIGKTILSRLVELALKLDKPDEAADYYHRFVKAAPNDATRYLLKYKIYKAQQAPIEDLIDALRSYKDHEYTERWAYELARLYSKAGMGDECVEECDDIILWFSEGVYVIRAMELKMKYTPLTPSQQEKYNNRYETTPELYEQPAVSQMPVAGFPQAGSFEQPQAMAGLQGAEASAPASQEEIFTSTVDLQERLSESLMKVIGGIVHNENSPMGQEIHMDVEPETLEAIQEYHDVRELEPEQLVSGSSGVRREAVVTRPDSRGSAAGTDIDFSAMLEAQVDLLTGAGEMTDGMDEAAAAREQEDTAEEMPGMAENRGETSLEDVPADAFGKTIDMPAEAFGKTIDISAAIRSGSGQEDTAETETASVVSQDAAVEEAAAVQAEPVAVEREVMETAGEPTSAVPEALETAIPNGGMVSAIAPKPVDAAVPVEPVAPAASDPEEAVVAAKPVVPAVSEPEEAVVAAKPVVPAVSEPEEAVVAAKPVVPAVSEPEEPIAVVKPAAPVVPETVPDRDTAISAEPKAAEPTTPVVSAEKTGSSAIPEIVQTTPKTASAESEQAVYVPETADIASDKEAREWVWPKVESRESKVTQNGKSVDKAAEPEMPRPAAEVISRKPEKVVSENPEPKTGPMSMTADPDELDLEALLASEVEQMVGGMEKPAPKPEPEKDLITRLEEEADRSIVHEELEKETPQDKRYRIIHADRPNRLTEEQKRLFTYFSKIPGMDEQILDAIHNTYNGAVNKTSRRGNIAIMGRPGTGKTHLSAGLVRSLCREFEMPAAKIARVGAKDLNQKDVAKVVGKMSGGFLIIEQASRMTPETIHSLSRSMEFRTDSMILLIEDDKQDMRQLLADYPEFAEKFDSVISIPVFTNDELVTFARTYAGERGYKMDEMGVLALYTIIGDNQKEDEPVSVAQVKEMVDSAIRKASRGGRRFGRKLSGRQTDENNRIILYEKDFGIR